MCTLHLVLAGLIAVSAASAAAPVATVTSAGPVRISGADVPATAAASLPVGIGDQVSTLDSAALIRFEDKGVITLARHSSVNIERKGDRMIVSLVQGAFDYKFLPGSNLTARKYNMRSDFQNSALQGSLNIPLVPTSRVPAAPALSSATTKLIIGFTANVGSHRSNHCPPGHGDNTDDHDCRIETDLN